MGWKVTMKKPLDAGDVSGFEKVDGGLNRFFGVSRGRQVEGPFRGRHIEVVNILVDRLEVVFQGCPASDDGVSLEIGQPTVLQHHQHDERRHDRDHPDPEQSISAEAHPLRHREPDSRTVSRRVRRGVFGRSHGVLAVVSRFLFTQNIAQEGGGIGDFCSLVTSLDGLFRWSKGL